MPEVHHVFQQFFPNPSISSLHSAASASSAMHTHWVISELEISTGYTHQVLITVSRLLLHLQLFVVACTPIRCTHHRHLLRTVPTSCVCCSISEIQYKSTTVLVNHLPVPIGRLNCQSCLIANNNAHPMFMHSPQHHAHGLQVCNCRWQ